MFPNNPAVPEQPVFKITNQAAWPTRISCEKNDMGYAAFMQFGGASTGWVIKLDSHEVKDVVMADSVRGSVCVFARDHKGHFILDPRKQVVRRYMHGKVEIIPPIVHGTI